MLIDLKSADQVQVQGHQDFDFLTSGHDVGKITSLEQAQGPGNQNRAKIMQGKHPEKAEPMLKEDSAESDKKFLEDIR